MHRLLDRRHLELDRDHPELLDGTVTTHAAVAHEADRLVLPLGERRIEGVEYVLTPLGGTLLDTMKALLAWTASHIEEVDAARERYDALPPRATW